MLLLRAMLQPAVRVVDALPSGADLAIVGGGAIGCATAFFAARAGLRVVVLERRPALATLTTSASAGAFRLQFDNAEEIALVREGIDLFDDFGARTGLDGWDLGLRHGGYLFCSLTDASLARAGDLVARQRDWGLTDVELMTGDEARSRWPWLSPSVLGVRFRAGDGWLDPKALAIGYATAASDAERIPDASGGGSASFLPGTDVAGVLLTSDGSRARGLRTSRGDLEADAVLLAAGPFLGHVASTAEIELPIAPTRRQKLVIPQLASVPAWEATRPRKGPAASTNASASRSPREVRSPRRRDPSWLGSTPVTSVRGRKVADPPPGASGIRSGFEAAVA